LQEVRGEAPSDFSECLTDGGVFVGRNRQDLCLVVAMLGHDDERRGTLALDVELDPAQTFEWDVEVGAVGPAHYGDAPIGHYKARALTAGFDLNFLVALKEVAKRIVCHRK
jgi:hypothetical protein